MTIAQERTSVDAGVPAVVGRQAFVELWSLLGFSGLVCETPQEFPPDFSLLNKLAELNGAMPPLVLTEEAWFDGLRDALRRRLKASRSPLWVTLPTPESEDA